MFHKFRDYPSRDPEGDQGGSPKGAKPHALPDGRASDCIPIRIPGSQTVAHIAARLMVCALLLSSSALADGPVQVHYRQELAAKIASQVTGSLDDLVAFYKDLHANPELSLQEERSAGRIAQRLQRLGYAVTSNVGGHGVVAVLANGNGPTVLIRGDMDALPVTEETGLPYRSRVTAISRDGTRVGVMHACGHDLHQTCLIGTAAVLAELRDQWSGTALIIAQPAEEIGKGALAMINDGLFERFPRPDACLGLHVSASVPAGDITYSPGWAMANVDSVDITIYGRGGHGSRPHETIDPVVAAAHTVVALQTIVARRVDPLEPAVISVGSIHAGSKHNIISNQARMQVTVRSYNEHTRKILLDGIRQVTINTCRALGCTRDPDIHLRDDEFTPATYNDPALTAAAAEVLARVVGDDHIKSVKPVMGGEDFGRYGRYLNVPSLMFWLGSIEQARYQASKKPGAPLLPPLHSSTYAPDPAPTISTGVRCMSSLALSLLDPKP
ncbi:MAG: amidohydrolase [Phycisphaerae bacterium]